MGQLFPLTLLLLTLTITLAEEPPAARIDGTAPGWVALGEKDFVQVNCDHDTWTWREDGVLACTGTPVGVIRTRRPYTNLELLLQWRHLKRAGNSGVFLWAPEKPLFDLQRNQLPHGIEVQILDHGYTAAYENSTKKKADWFTTHGDVFPVGSSTMKPFPPVSPDGSRSFPRKNRSKGIQEWNHYYIRAINGEIRLWVNGEEVSGGQECNPKTGYVCLESEGSPIEFKGILLRELP
ncbi:MAG TPA: DUF1080 domain-containing protein [Gemmatales bacterium]|nr:DUF1080 domain-containing protein [Gemmatales bacterium]